MEPIVEILPPHIKETIQSIAGLQSAHDDQASPFVGGFPSVRGILARGKDGKPLPFAGDYAG